MANIVIKDLPASGELDRAAMAGLSGGGSISFGFIVPYRRPSAGTSPTVLNQYFQVNQYFADQIQIINQNQFVNIDNSNNANVVLGEGAKNDLPTTLLPGV